MNQIEARISTLPATALKDMAAKLYADERDGADMVLTAVLDALMTRLPEGEFVTFCDGLQ